jgi:hypothetical protein
MISTIYTPTLFVGNESTSTPYSVPWQGLDPDDIHALVVTNHGESETLSHGAGMIVTVNPTTKAVSFTTSEEIPASSTVKAYMTMDYRQLVDLQNSSNNDVNIREGMFDRVTLFLQIVQAEAMESVAKSLRVPEFIPEFPEAGDRKDTMIQFDQIDGQLKLLKMTDLAKRLLVILGADAVLPQRIIEINEDAVVSPDWSNAIVRVNSQSDVVITLPTTEEFDETYNVVFQRIGDGAVEFVGDSGVVIDATLFRIYDKFTAVSCHWVGLDRWTIYGDLY